MTATTNNGHEGAKKPLLFFSAFPGEGHTNPLISIASYLVKQGYEVVFMTPPPFQKNVEEAGAEWLHVDNPFSPEIVQALCEAATLPAGPERLAGQYNQVFMASQPTRTQSTEDALVTLQARDPNRQIIFLEDVFNGSFWAFRHGRPLPKGFQKLPKTIGFGVTALLIESRDAAPISLGLPPDSTDSGRQRNQALHKLFEKGPFKIVIDAWQDAMRKCGCTSIPDGNFWRSCYLAHDVALQLCSPSLEYPLSDIPPSIHYVGVLPRKAASPSFEYPPWWPVVNRTQEGSQYRHVVFVSQGTLNLDYSELILPSINAFSDREDIFVVATLGSRGAQLPADVVIPSNARVIDYMPYDTILEYTDVFISNAGYGTFTHAVRNGVPVVLAGENEEKVEVTMRAVYAGLGYNLATQTPTAENVRKAVEHILQDNKYKKAAMKLKIENNDMNALARIEAHIAELTE